MTELNITEAGSVQFPMVRHAAEIGWTPLSPSTALAMRGGEAGFCFVSCWKRPCAASTPG